MSQMLQTIYWCGECGIKFKDTYMPILNATIYCKKCRAKDLLKDRLEYEKIKIKNFWNEISDFEIGEIKNESSNILLVEARAGARMEAYVNMFYQMIWRSV